MSEFDDLFDEHFGDLFNNNDEFNLRSLFNDYMNKLEKNKKDISSMKLEDLMKLVKDNGGNLPLSPDDLDNLIDKFNFDVISLDIIYDNGEYFINETLGVESNMVRLTRRYRLNSETFQYRNDKFKLINMMIDKNYDYKEYISFLSKEDQIKIYNRLLNKSVEREEYEYSAFYRDLINDLNS